MFRPLALFSLVILLLAPAAPAKEGDASFSVSPDSAFTLLESAILGAKKTIDVNVYMLTNRNVGAALVKKASEGVVVRVLIEGEPHGGTVFPAVKQALDDLHLGLQAAASGSALFVMTSNGSGQKRRFVFNHAKYVIVDRQKVFVTSENFTGSAYPNPKKKVYAGGSRGWQVMVENRKIANELGGIFASDLKGPDVVPYAEAKITVADPGQSTPLPDRPLRSVKSFPIASGESSGTTLCVSPASEKCVLDFIRSAKKELLVEHLSLGLSWKNHETGRVWRNPIVNELLAAASRGVRVKVLLNDEKSFADDEKTSDEFSNTHLVGWLKKEAMKEKLPLEAALFSGAATETAYVHNKGMVADGARVFVSSINGTQNSVVNNREVAVAVDSTAGASYFGEVFDFDWQKSNP